MGDGARDRPKRTTITARPDEGVIINEPSLIRIRRGRKNEGCRLRLEITTASGKVKAVKRDLDIRRPSKEDSAN